MRVAIVTPYFKEPRDWLERCMSSVREQSHACDHLMVSDGHAQDWLDRGDIRHVKLDRSHADYGNTPRSIGAQLAVSEGYDAIAFLDADNWYEPDHVARCVDVASRTNADVVAAKRHWVRADGSRMQVRMGEDEDGSHVDTNCLFLLFGAFHTVPRWSLSPKPMAMWCDRFYLASLRQEGLQEAAVEVPTVNYLCTWAAIYRAAGETPPPFAKEPLSADGLRKWIQGMQPGDLAHVRRLSGCDLKTYFSHLRAA